MSCDAVASIALLWLAATGPATGPERAAPPAAVAFEPLFADIVKRAGALKAEVEAFRQGDRKIPNGFRKRIQDLAELDMKGHVTLRDRGLDGDLKCILKGIAQDLPQKLAALDGAATPKARESALRDMAYLLNDNVEVITAPPTPPV